MMQKRRFVQTDVFTEVPGKGNGLAVVVDSDGLTTAAMQSFAAWTNLAETTFLLPPTHDQADYRVRIFTPAHEMPFAGHPTLGSCAAWLHCGGVPKAEGVVVQECEIGVVDIVTSGKMPAFVAPDTEIRDMPEETLMHLCAALRLQREQVVGSALLNNGPSWQTLELRSAADVLTIDSRLVQWPAFQGVSVFGRHAKGEECDFEVRNLSPSSGMSEDPITGSLNAAIAKWLHRQNRIDGELLVAQGTVLDRMGRVLISGSKDGMGDVLIGGHSQIVIDGHVHL